MSTTILQQTDFLYKTRRATDTHNFSFKKQNTQKNSPIGLFYNVNPNLSNNYSTIQKSCLQICKLVFVPY